MRTTTEPARKLDDVERGGWSDCVEHGCQLERRPEREVVRREEADGGADAVSAVNTFVGMAIEGKLKTRDGKLTTDQTFSVVVAGRRITEWTSIDFDAPDQRQRDSSAGAIGAAPVGFVALKAWRWTAPAMSMSRTNSTA